MRRWKMWKSMLFALSVCLAFTGALSAAAAEGGAEAADRGSRESAPRADFYVSLEGNDAWSGTSNEPNESGTDGPFRTLERAQSAVREAIADGMTADVVVEVRGGTYALDETLSFGPADSGRDGFDVIYRGAPGERAALSAGERITAWSTTDGVVYAANVGTDRPFDTMYENDRRSVKARYPNQGLPREGYQRTIGYQTSSPKRKFGFQAGDIPALADIGQLEAVVWPGGPSGEANWQRDEKKVVSIDEANRIVTLDSDTSYEIGPGSRYYVQNHPALLDAPGEFYLDKASGTLFYRPYRLPIEEQTIVVPRLGRVLGFVGASEANPVEHIVWDGIDVAYGDSKSDSMSRDIDDGAIYMTNARSIVIRNGRISNVGLTGILAAGPVQGLAAIGNDISDIGHVGIHLAGAYNTRRYVNKDNEIVNNRVAGTGRIMGYSSGIGITNSGANYVAYNRVEDTPRFSIGLSATPINQYVGTTLDGVPVTEANKQDFVQTRDNLFEYNDLSNANTDSQDTGLFYSWGYTLNNTFARNYVHDSGIHFSFGYAVYLDDESNGFTIEDNLIVRQQNAGDGNLNASIVTKGIGNRIVNNLIADSPRALSGFSTITQSNNHGPTRDNDFVRNILYNAGQSVYAHNSWHAAAMRQSDYNVFYQPSGKYVLNNTSAAVTLADWKDALNGKYDQHSIATGHVFANAPEQDYRLAPDSAARGMGIRDIDVSRMGLLPAFAFADPLDPLERIYLLTDAAGSGAALELGSKEQAQLDVRGRTVRGFAVAPSRNDVKFRSDDPSVASVNDNGVVKANKSGVARITATVASGGFVRSVALDVFVDDRMSELVVQAPKPTLTLGETTELAAYGRTRFGQVKDLSGMNVSYSSSDDGIVAVDASGKATGVGYGAADVTVSAVDPETGAVLEQAVDIAVVSSKLNGLKATLETKGLHPGQSSNLLVAGTMSDGTPADLTEASWTYESDRPDIVSVDANGVVTAVGAGQATITVTATLRSVTKSTRLYIVVFEEETLPAPWQVSHYGNASGTALYEDGKFRVLSNGYDVWGTADDFVYLHQNASLQEGEAVTVTARIESVVFTNANASSGVMLRSGDGDGAKHVHFRLLPNGNSVLVYRTSENGSSSYAPGPRFQFPQGGYIRLTLRDAVATAAYFDPAANQWVKVRDFNVDLGHEVMAGVGVFAQSDVMTESIVSELEVAVE
ncbi:hypothetical protein FE782_13305 [Paenibacillus antri]|uniref:BIG2 domain-containing protein n=1 Tax=Paenibacillus antri TaxID=2582848 RepID=A0A5R9GET6_9BACL|nr:Ig-like domain-containing protein [Paenibacillus antri]TLS51878.1 hypothetical protein FE782_13305 [Paenibacillus antri]